MRDQPPFDMPPVSAGFDARGGWVLNRLMAESSLGLTNPIHAAAIVGNLGGESGLEAINERHPIVPGSRGGWSWAQWTGPRRDEFEAYASEHGLPLDSDQVAYEFLVKELTGSEKHALDQTKKTTALDAAVYTFEVLFERPSDPQGGLPSRIAFAKKALAAAGHQVPATPATPPTPAPIPPPALPTPAPLTEPTTPVPPASVPAPSQPPPVIPPGSLPDIVLQRGPWWMVPGIATLVLLIFAGALTASCFMDNDTLRTQMFAIAGAGFTTVLGYLFGSSAGSQKKDDLAAAKAAIPQPQPPPTA